MLNEPVNVAGLNATIGPIAYTGVFSVGIAFTAQVVAQRCAHATDAAIVLSAETLFAALFGFLLMNDRLGTAGMLGFGLIFFSIVGGQLLPMWRTKIDLTQVIH